MEVTKEGWFEAAHMLSNYNGLCSNLHGHSYRYRIGVNVADNHMTDDMVLDFNDIKAVVNAYDHAVIFGGAGARDEREQELVDWAEKHRVRRVIMPDNQRPTCENMAAEIARRVASQVRIDNDSTTPWCVSVDLWETHSGHASYAYITAEAPDGF